MNNEDFLTEFEEWLHTQPASKTPVSQVLSIISEFAKYIDPVQLAEATAQQMNAFQSGHKPQVAIRSRGQVEQMIARVEKVRAEDRYDQIEYAMLMFRNFRNSVLKNRKGE